MKYGFRYAFFWSPHISIGTKPLVSEERAIEASVAPALKKLYQSVFPWIEQAAPHTRICTPSPAYSTDTTSYSGSTMRT